MNNKQEHINYIKQAIQLAKKGIGFVNPNPLVGAIIVKNGKIISEGYHQKFGEAHAEINAINSAKESLEGATMYVTLEPCSHYGKTPPCAIAITQTKITKVVIGMLDPNPLVAGRGVKILKENNIEVEVGFCKDELIELNEIFLHYIANKTPFITLKTAMSLDGKISTYSGDSKWISNEKSREYVHQLRQKNSGILVGVDTVIADNPTLNTRLKNQNCSHPIRIVLDSTCRIPLDSKLLNSTEISETIIACTKNASTQAIERIENKGVKVIVAEQKDNKVDFNHLLKKIGELGIDSILIEGGASVNFSAIESGNVNKIISFIAPKLIGGNTAKTPVGGKGFEKINEALQLKNISINKFDEDIMISAYTDN